MTQHKIVLKMVDDKKQSIEIAFIGFKGAKRNEDAPEEWVIESEKFMRLFLGSSGK